MTAKQIDLIAQVLAWETECLTYVMTDTFESIAYAYGNGLTELESVTDVCSGCGYDSDELWLGLSPACHRANNEDFNELI